MTDLSDGSGGEGSATIEGLTSKSFSILCADVATLVRIPDKEFSDLTIVTGGRKVPVHRCILAARCPGLRKILLESDLNNKHELELTSLGSDWKLGFDSLMAVLGYVYGGSMEPWPATVPCLLSSCSHFTCRPTINYVLEILRASFLFILPELKNLAQVAQSVILLSFCCSFSS